MKFAYLPVQDAEGALLAHSISGEGFSFKKGRRLSAKDIADLKAVGITTIAAIRLGPDDVPEDEASTHMAAALGGKGISVGAAFTGRANLYAAESGILSFDQHAIGAVNRIDEAITIACLRPFSRVAKGQMIATVKVIPFACPRAALDRFDDLAPAAHFTLHPFRPRRVGYLATTLPGLKASILSKTQSILADRLTACGSEIAVALTCAHEISAIADTLRQLADQGTDPILIFGASAIVDRNDVVPAGIVAAGGTVRHFGMPVDPGNLLLLAELNGTPVIGLPGCARSPKLNGFDWVLERLLAGIPVGGEDIATMGVGGLLKEIASRPQPRERTHQPAARPRIAAIILAAGQSRRMGPVNKLTASVNGKPMIRHVADACVSAQLEETVIVTGHAADEVAALLTGLPVRFAHNPDYESGMASSLRTGLEALSKDIDAALICLGDMPDITPHHLNRLIAAFDVDENRSICVPTVRGKRGNPVLWGADFFIEMKTLTGDAGARNLIGEHADLVCEVPFDDEAPLTDIDTPDRLAGRQPPPVKS